ncbi:MAG: hypothetical protein MJA83_10445, partial [Gammaproteobacteria bacterium]|nr:hypothetical protein [Gammaproteobacteria bacterium]
IHLQDGPNTLEAVIRDKNHRIVEKLNRTVHYSGSPVRAELVPELSHLVADGKTKPVIAVKFYDRWGHPARAGSAGKFQLSEPYRIYEDLIELQERQLLSFKPRQPLYKILNDGIALIELAPTTESGSVVFDFEFNRERSQQLRAWLQSAAREWILVGIAEGTGGYNDVSGNMENLDDANIDEDYFQDGRIAFFAKGQVKGKYLLTVAYDSDKQSDLGEDGLFQTIDPDRFYTIYGDATEQRYDAPSIRKLYVKIEKDRFFALFGDFDTGLDYTELSRYSRRFNGLKSEYATDKFSVKAFAAESTQAFIKDELQGDGTSGLYQLSRQRIIPNSETITIEIRDRFRSEVIVSSQTMTRHLDYNIDYFAGTIFFKRPVPTRDDQFNPVFIVADYEVNGLGEEDVIAGGRAAAHLMDNKLELGATVIDQNTA